MAWPGWYEYPGIWYNGPYLSFGIGFGLGFFSRFGWGWHHWGFDWHNHYATFNNGRYYSRSNTFYNRNSYYRGGGARVRTYNAGGGVRGGAYSARGGAGGGVSTRSGATVRPFEGNTKAARGYIAPSGQSGTRSGAFSSIEKGGQAKSYSARGSASLSGGKARGAGGGATHAGGGSHGGGGGHH